MDKLLEYIKNIGYFLILMSLVSNVMPDNSYKKYCRMFCGIILVVLVINPFYEFLNYDGDIKDIFVAASYESRVKELENQLKMNESSTKERAINEYEHLIVNELQGIAKNEDLFIVDAKIEFIEEPEIQLTELKLLVTENIEDINEGNIDDSLVKIDKITIGDSESNDSQSYMTNPKVLSFVGNAAEHLKLDSEIIVVELYKGENYGE